MKAKCKIVAKLAKTPQFGKRSAEFVLAAMVDKCGDQKVKAEAVEALTEMAEKLSLDFIGNQVCHYHYWHMMCLPLMLIIFLMNSVRSLVTR